MATTVRSRRKSKAQVFADFAQHLVLKADAAAIANRSNRLKAGIKEWLADNFSYENENGSKFVDLPETVFDSNGQAYRGMELRRSQPDPLFDEEKAAEVLKGVSDSVYKAALSTYIDQDKVYLLVQQGKITEDQLDAMFTEQEPTWAFWPVKGSVDD